MSAAVLAPEYDPFPAVMVARCADGHAWSVAVTWHSTLLREDRTWDPRVKSPAATPRYCAQCFAIARLAAPYVGLARLEDARADLPSVGEGPRWR